MVKRNDCINNPVTGERMEFLKTAEDTEGGLLQIRMTLKPHGPRFTPVLHPVQEKHILVNSGKLNVKVGEEVRELTSGQQIDIPRGTPHTWWNGGDDEASYILEFRPALQTEDLFTTLYALARAGKTDKTGAPGLLQNAVMTRKYKYEVYMAKPSIRIQKLISRSIAWFARLLGYQADFPYKRDAIVLEAGRSNGELATVPVENRCS